MMPRVARVVVCVALTTWSSLDFRQNAQQATPGSSQPAGDIPQARPSSTSEGAEPPDPPPVAPHAVAKPVPPTPIAVKKAELDEPAWDPVWSRFIEKSLPPDLLSNKREHAVRSLCPRFKYLNDEDRRVFWAYFFQALSAAEAGLRPTVDVRHNDPEVAVMDPVTHHIARQEGLLQLAYMDSERYGCAFDWEKDKDLPEHDPSKTILQPENNLDCGIKILTNQIVTRNKPLLSSNSYWVTLQPGHPSFYMFLKQMANEPAFCGRERVHGYLPDEGSQEPQSEASR